MCKASFMPAIMIRQSVNLFALNVDILFYSHTCFPIIAQTDSDSKIYLYFGR